MIRTSCTTRINALRTLAVAGLALSMGVFTGCRSQSRYTKDATSAAEMRMDQLKSATSWDMARQAFLAGNLDKAEKHINISIGLNPEVAKSHTLLGRIKVEKGNLGEAIASFDTAIRTDEKYVDAYYFKGVVLERLGDLETALLTYMTAADLDEYASPYAIAAAEVLVDLGRVAEAEQYLLSRGEFLPHDAGIRHTLGHIARLNGKDADSLRLLHEAWLLAPNDNIIIEDLVNAQVVNNDFLSAEANLSQLITKDEYRDRQDLKILLARCLTNLGRPLDARQTLFDVVRSPKGLHNAEAWLGLGHISYKVGDLRTLREAAGRLTEIASSDAHGYILWSLYYRAQGEHETVLGWIDEAASRNGDRAYLLTLRGLTLRDLGRQNEAFASFRAASQLDPNNAQLQKLMQGDTFASAPTE